MPDDEVSGEVHAVGQDARERDGDGRAQGVVVLRVCVCVCTSVSFVGRSVGVERMCVVSVARGEQGELGPTNTQIPIHTQPSPSSSSSYYQTDLEEAVGPRDLVEERRAGQDEEGGLRRLVVQELEGVDAQLVLPRLDQQLVKCRRQQPRSRPERAGLGWVVGWLVDGVDEVGVVGWFGGKEARAQAKGRTRLKEKSLTVASATPRQTGTRESLSLAGRSTPYIMFCSTTTTGVVSTFMSW